MLVEGLDVVKQKGYVTWVAQPPWAATVRKGVLMAYHLFNALF